MATSSSSKGKGAVQHGVDVGKLIREVLEANYPNPLHTGELYELVNKRSKDHITSPEISRFLFPNPVAGVAVFQGYTDPQSRAVVEVSFQDTAGRPVWGSFERIEAWYETDQDPGNVAILTFAVCT
jgi:hypothetical protein